MVFLHRDVGQRGGVAVTDRHGGASTGPWATLNLGDHVDDDPHAVAGNWETVRAALPAAVDRVARMHQVHGADVAVVGPDADAPPTADALVSRTPGTCLAVLVADCLPVLLADEFGGVVGAAHAGRRGLAAGVVPATVDAMVALGAQPDRIAAVVGPGICAEHYEVPAAMRTEVAALVPAAAATTRDGAPALDIRAGVLAQLAVAGVRDIRDLPRCTAETPALYSHRRDGATGRFAGLVWLA